MRAEDKGLRMISLGVITQALHDYFYGEEGDREDARAFFHSHESPYPLYLDALDVEGRPTPYNLLDGLANARIKIAKQGLIHGARKNIDQVYDLLHAPLQCGNCGSLQVIKHGKRRGVQFVECKSCGRVARGN